MIRSLNINIENVDDSDKVNLIHNVNYLFVTKTLYIFHFSKKFQTYFGRQQQQNIYVGV